MSIPIAQELQRQCIPYKRDALRTWILPFLTLLAAMLSGCARGVATTTVNANGSWVRRTAFHGSKPDKDGNAMGTKIEDAFLLPKGEGWKITRQTQNDELTVLAERAQGPGETLHGDLTLMGGNKHADVIATNTVTVQKMAPGVYKYTETLHWKGAVPKELTPDADMVAAFQKALPPAVANEANARDLAARSIREIWHVLFGPGDPLISEFSAMLAQPELIERRVQRRIGTNLEQQLTAKFGERLTGEQRHAVARKIVASMLENLFAKTKSKSPVGPQAGNKDEDSGPGAALFLSVKMPGRIIQTNGEQDAFQGDVFWTLYPEAAALGDVTLTATCDTNRQAAMK